MRHGIRFLCVAALALVFATAASAQLSKGFRGKVTDRDGKPVVGVTVVLQDKSNKSNRYEIKTDDKGNYIYAGLPYSQDGYLISVKVGDLPEVQKLMKPKILDTVEVNFDMRKDIQVQEQKTTVASAAADAQQLFQMEDYEGALKKSDEAILQNESEKHVKVAKKVKALSLTKLDRTDEAIAACEAYNKAYPGDKDILGHMANLYEKKGDTAKADEYKKAFKAKGGQIIGESYNAGVAAFNAGDTAKAIESFEAAVKEDPKDALAHRELAKCHAQTGKYSKAVEELKIYLKMKPDAEDKAMWEQAIPNLQKLKDTK